MCNPGFSTRAALESYFHPLAPRDRDKKVNKVRVVLTVASYFTVVIPVAFGIVYACSNPLRGRATYPSLVSSTESECQVFADTIPASLPESLPAQSAPLLTFHEELVAWATSEGGRAVEAALRIENAYQNNLKKLDLSYLGLKTLPSVIGQLGQLEALELSSNELTTLPAVIAQLSLLRTLALSENQLETLPAVIGQLERLEVLVLSENQLRTLPAEIGQLQKLEMIDLCGNQLRTLPAVIGQLRQLRVLYLSENQFTILPVEIGELQELVTLDFSNNPAVSEIPIAWNNLLNITNLDVDGTSIPTARLDQVLAAIQAQRGATAAERLPSKLKLWKDNAQIIPDLSLDIGDLSEEQKEMLYEWLLRLEKSRDFQLSQHSLCETACRMLHTVLTDSAFREIFFVQVKVNLEGCGDRAAMSFNEIYTAWVLATLPPQETIHKKLEILTGVARTNTLRTCLQKAMSTHERETGIQQQESAEIYLYYENALLAELSLISATRNMLYDTLGRRDWIDESNLIRQVMASYFDILIEIPAFDALIKQNEFFMKRWESIEAQFQEKLGEVLPEEGNSEGYLTRALEIQKGRNLAWKTEAIRWVQGN